MILNSYVDLSSEWKNINLPDQSHELVILETIIPWQLIITRLVSCYSKKSGAIGKSLRTMVALLIVSRLRTLSDREVVKQVKENRYIQYFCNVTDKDLQTFVHPSTLSVFRKRIGEEGVAAIEEENFFKLRDAGIITGDDALIDSSVLQSNIIFPTDIQLIVKAFGKMDFYADILGGSLWQDYSEVKKLWRACNLDKKKTRLEWLQIFFDMFVPALKIFQESVSAMDAPNKHTDKADCLLNLLILLKEQTSQKLDGQRHIKDRIVSLDDTDARPIKKGKKHPKCEFGTTEEFAFNRDGFLISIENFIGKPSDTKLYPGTVELYIERMKRCPNTVVTDGAYRSRDNIKNNTPDGVEHLFMGRSTDVDEEVLEFCKKARSATEGFIAVAKNLRGFGKSMYNGIKGHRIWSSICQLAYNLKKFLQLYSKDMIGEESLINLGILS